MSYWRLRDASKPLHLLHGPPCHDGTHCGELWQAALCICFQAANNEGLSLIDRQCGVIGSELRDKGAS